jgi:hypothetical protein
MNNINKKIQKYGIKVILVISELVDEDDDVFVAELVDIVLICVSVLINESTFA